MQNFCFSEFLIFSVGLSRFHARNNEVNEKVFLALQSFIQQPTYPNKMTASVSLADFDPINYAKKEKSGRNDTTNYFIMT